MPRQDHGRLLSAGAVIKDPLGTVIDHVVVLLQGDDKRMTHSVQRTWWGADAPIP